MKRILKWLHPLVLVLTLGVTQGCALLLIGAGAGAAVGVVSYVDNELRVTHEVPLDRAWAAANGAMRELEFTVIPAETRKDGLGGIVHGRNAQSQTVRIQLVRQTDQTTEIRLRVGEFDTAANQAAVQRLYARLKARL